jgi:hypothetical protein
MPRTRSDTLRIFMENFKKKSTMKLFSYVAQWPGGNDLFCARLKTDISAYEVIRGSAIQARHKAVNEK